MLVQFYNALSNLLCFIANKCITQRKIILGKILSARNNSLFEGLVCHSCESLAVTPVTHATPVTHVTPATPVTPVTPATLATSTSCHSYLLLHLTLPLLPPQCHPGGGACVRGAGGGARLGAGPATRAQAARGAQPLQHEEVHVQVPRARAAGDEQGHGQVGGTGYWGYQDWGYLWILSDTRLYNSHHLTIHYGHLSYHY